MSALNFCCQCAFAVTVLVSANGVVQRLAVNSIPRQLIRAAERSEPATDLFLGNSTMAAGLDERAFERAKPGSRALNAGMGSSSPVEHYLLFRQLQKHRGATLYYGFIDTQLTDAPEGDWTELVGNRAMAYYIEPDVAMQFYAADSPLDALRFRLITHVPMAIERVTIWARVERLRRLLASIGLPEKETNRFGRAEDFALLESAPSDFVARCERAVNENRPMSAPVSRLFREAQDSRSALFVIEMPLPRAHRERYYSRPEWIAYRAHLERLVQAAGGQFVPAADWVPDSGFSDHLHLNATGAREFSTQLAEWAISH